MKPMEYGTIEREIHVDASPEVVFEVISSPGHMQQWWPDRADFEPAQGSVGELVWDGGTGVEAMVVPITVVETEPPRLFRFRWAHPQGEEAREGNSLLVTFELTPSGTGTSVRLTESGFREMGWEAAVLEEQYREHGTGWDHYLPRLGEYVARLASSR
jgi:uncharacterized protein YndB with AHSA1/START domain